MAHYDFEEIEVIMPSGQIIAGKWYGNKALKPFLCLHGWEDNAGTFDRLLPMLSKEYSYLAIDLPGHGRSSWIPHGMQYKVVDFLHVIDFLYKHYNWNKISFISHSMGARIAFLYASLYPDRVEMMISIDVLSITRLTTKEFNEQFHQMYDNFLKSDQRNRENTEPPAYSLNEMTDRIVKGTFKSVTPETAHFLLERNIKPSKKHPGKYYFARDRRVQSRLSIHAPQEIQLELAKRLTMPFLYIRVSNSSYRKVHREENEDKIMKKVLLNHSKFKFYLVDSNSHHIHLTEPEKIVPVISEFMKNFKDVKSHL